AKSREFSELRYRVAMDGVSFDPASKYYTPNAMTIRDAGTPERYFTTENFGIVDTFSEGGQIRRYLHSNFIYDQTRPENLYTGEEKISALYGMMVYELSSRLKTIVGVRMEHTDIEVTSEKKDADGNPTIGAVKGFDFLPSLNFIYALNSKSNLRLSGTRTLARPNMRELAPFAALDFIGGFVYEGSPNVKRTQITNADLRWEVYPKSGEVIAVSGFFKDFKDPIIRVFDPLKPNPTIRFDNVENAQVYGLELELRKGLDFISPALKNFKATTNVTLVKSIAKINPQELAAARNNNPDFPSTRPLQGQSPFIVNAALTYDNDSAGFDATLSFNLFGKRLAQVGTLGTPDIYERPIPTLNLVMGKTLGKHWSMSLKVSNMLDATYQLYQEYKGTKYVPAPYQRGVSTSIGISYKL
ncbi:MAG: TonB-dependent receptor, partial [Bacteroidota bacterium]|nr:TonB-dependent receptor [Bacteroidota bacterium]MDX5431243.1 TonB-dependent receptor [Bacteroidota bacterium]MDX5469982.1 TonB-dependent receptor [Bacteroidota bacterium]